MKTAPVFRALHELEPRAELVLVHTGQHYDPQMSDVFLRELELPKPDVFLGVGSGSHAVQTARTLEGLERVLVDRRPDLVVVAGDVNSTLGAALAAAKLSIPVAHIESGLRSFDPSMPEELNRKLTDHIASVLLAHSDSAVDNLVAEGIPGSRISLVGNTMIDTVLSHLEAARGTRSWQRFGLEPRRFGLVTLHRPTLVDDPRLLDDALRELSALAGHMELVFPVHPRTLARLEAAGRTADGRGRLKLTGPLAYHDFLALEAEAAFVLTDSGGVQEETSALGVRCFTLRDSTERPVTVELGTNTVLGLEPERIAEIPALVEEERRVRSIPLWDGRAGERAAEVLASFLRDRATPVEAVH
jgi:UDP-N-acetylglucosamine 2-epimerase (non-hydrolysing)